MNLESNDKKLSWYETYFESTLLLLERNSCKNKLNLQENPITSLESILQFDKF